MDLYQTLKSFLFQMDAERAHNFVIQNAHNFPFMGYLFSNQKLDKNFQVDIAGLKWSSPVGLAAGLDKNAEAINFFTTLGFGAVEVGTVTPYSQVGNERPRMFRYIEEESLRNRMGFNNDGSSEILENLKNSNSNGKVVGVNLGKNKWTTLKNAHKDYQMLYDKFSPFADYLVINVSSPNTPGLRQLQEISFLEDIFDSLFEGRKKVNKPLFLKISPDMAIEDISGVVELCKNKNLAGIIGTNTSVDIQRGPGGMSGKLIFNKSKSIRELFLKEINGTNLEFIGVGGFSNYEQLVEFWKLGGKAIQIYTSFIFQGPSILSSINKSIKEDLVKNNISDLESLIKEYQR